MTHTKWCGCNYYYWDNEIEHFDGTKGVKCMHCKKVKMEDDEYESNYKRKKGN